MSQTVGMGTVLSDSVAARAEALSTQGSPDFIIEALDAHRWALIDAAGRARNSSSVTMPKY